MNKAILLLLVAIVSAGLMAGAVSASNYHSQKDKKDQKNKQIPNINAQLQAQAQISANKNNLTNTNTNTATSTSSATNANTISNNNTFNPTIVLQSTNSVGAITVSSSNINAQEQLVR